MKIDRSNYEIWIIDWLEGNLTALQVEQLNLFLGENPELKEEFDELTAVILKPSDKSFPQKDHLKKSPSDLSGSQFEYLCIACLENDISSDQRSELKEIIDQNTDKKKSFELINKLRLVPASVRYKYKSRLIKKPPFQRVIRLSVIGLSVAATIAFLVINYLIIPRNLTDEINNSAQTIAVNSSLPGTINEKTPDITIIDKKPDFIIQKNDTKFARVKINNAEINQSVSDGIIQNDPLPGNVNNPQSELKKIPVYTDIDLRKGINRNTLASSNSAFSIPQYDDERSNLKKFIAKSFREKILKETSTKDSPLKAYEIAEAGVTGLNKLLGWEMSLDKNTDENGELRSVYFSSKILKFNSPVKKTEPLL